MKHEELYKIIEEHQQSILPYTKHLLQNKHVLDIGSGNGITAKYFKDTLQCNIELTDIADIRIESTKNMPFKIGSASELPYETNSFDVAYMQYVLHHMPKNTDFKKTISEILRVSKQYAIIIEETKNENTNIENALEFDRMMNDKLHPKTIMPIHKYLTHQEILTYAPNTQIKSHLISKGNAENGFLETRVYIIKK